MKHSTKRGLSDVVTTVLIILLVLAAVAMIWGYLQGTLKSSGTQIAGGTECLNLGLSAVSCTASTATSAVVKYERNAQEANLTAVSLVFTYADGSSSTNSSGTVPSVLETRVYNATVTSKPVSVAVAGTVRTPAGDLNLCDKSAPVTCS